MSRIQEVIEAYKELGDLDHGSFVSYKPTKEENQPILNRHYHTGLKNFLRQYAPDFCWCFVYDLLLMVEQDPAYEDVSHDSLTATVYQLKKEGLFITKKTNHRRANQSRGLVGELYLRVR